jgi:hypothetical protein
MLSIKKTINLVGQSVVNDTIVVYMNANISKEGTTTSKNINSPELYNANKKAVRQDILEFEDKVYEIEDSINSDSEVAE